MLLQLAILALGLTVGIVWQCTTPIEFTGDSVGYLSIANWLARLEPAIPFYPYRPAGYSLILLATGVPWLSTFKFLMAIQTILAALIAVIVYRIIEPFGRRVALIVSLIAIASGTSTIHSSQVMTEQVFMFLLFLSIGLAASLVKPSVHHIALLYAFAIVSFMVTMVRPLAAPVFWVTLLLLVVFARNRLRHFVGAALVFCFLCTVHIVLDDALQKNVPTQFAGETGPQDAQERRFLHGYFRIQRDMIETQSADRYMHYRTVRELQSVMSAAIKRDYQAADPNVRRMVHSLGLQGRDADEMSRRLFSEPDWHHANYILASLRAGPPETRLRLLTSFADEFGTSGLKGAYTTLRENPLWLINGPSRGAGYAKFSLAYNALRHFNFERSWSQQVRPSLVQRANGPASAYLFSVLEQYLIEHPNVLVDREPPELFKSYENEPRRIAEALFENPNDQFAFFMSICLWSAMGYDNMSALLANVADETFRKYPEARLLLAWDTATMFVAGPPHIDYDHGVRQARLVGTEPFPLWAPDWLQADLAAEIRESYARHPSIGPGPAAFDTIYKAFYVGKPLFAVGMLVGLIAVLGSTHHTRVVVILLVPYVLSVATYALYSTATARYSDPTILIPLIVAAIGLCRSRRAAVDEPPTSEAHPRDGA
jgi:hypothetical protein